VAGMTNVMALTPGTELVGDFRIERVLGVGGFGITYLADEIALARSVTIKEYFPSDFAARGADQGAVPRSSDCAGDYKWGLDRFIEEAQTLARFDHRNICRVYRYFRANNTGYMVLQFEEGASLKGWLKGLGRAPRQAEIDKIVAPLLDALEMIHNAEFLHRDIAPDNIMVRKDGSPVLIDFGSARGDIARHSRTVSALVKPGYSPYEQYAETGARQGPWTDIYALGATLYHAVTGKRPPDSPSRVVKDDYVKAKDAALASYRPRFLAAIDRALDLEIDRRPKSVAAWRGDLLAPEPRPAKKGWLADEPEPKAAAAKTVILAPEGAAPPPPDVPGEGFGAPKAGKDRAKGDFRGVKLSNETHRSSIDPDDLLIRKSLAHPALPSHRGHVL
jgi:serine/threonine protein kinase